MVKVTLGLLVVSVLAVCAGCSSDGDPPKGFGINVTVNARQLSAADRARVVGGRIIASNGPESRVTLSKAIQSGEIRFRFVPAVMSGSMRLALEAQDAAGVAVASGISNAVDLVANKAVAVTIDLVPGALPNLGDGGLFDRDGGDGKPLGETCTTNNECGSSFCADGVCCNMPCNGSCESCAFPGRLGQCDPVPDNSDPQLECRPPEVMPVGDAGAPDDGGVADAGTELNVPDGGLMRNSLACAGTCNGQRACRFPGSNTVCGTKWCNGASEPAAMACNGAGSCEPALNQCVAYACRNGACLTQCAGHSDCQTATTYCGGDNTCKLKKDNGVACTVATECGSGHCSGGVCCNTACDAPLSCTMTPGSCRCPGVTCAEGVACQVYYRDADGDGFGDLDVIKPACAGAPPAGYVADSKDCDDGDANVKPGQTAFFDVPSANKKTYDYNCDGMLTKADLDNLTANCRFQYGEECESAAQTTCKTAGHRAGNGCAISCLGVIKPPLATASLMHAIISPVIRFCNPAARDGFTGAVGCGNVGTFRVCGTCGTAGQGPSAPANTSKKQACR